MSVSLEILNNNNSYRTTTAATAKSVKAAESKSVSIPVEESTEKAVANIDSFVHGGGSVRFGAYSKAMAMKNNGAETASAVSKVQAKGAKGSNDVFLNVITLNAAKRAGLNVNPDNGKIKKDRDFTEEKYAQYKVEKKKITDCFWCQTGGWKNLSGNGSSECARTASATMTSINSNSVVTPNDTGAGMLSVTVNNQKYSRKGDFAHNYDNDKGAEKGYHAYGFAKKSELLTAINTELSQGRSVAVKVSTNNNVQHWVTVTGTTTGRPAESFSELKGVDPWYNGNNTANGGSKGVDSACDSNYSGVIRLKSTCSDFRYTSGDYYPAGYRMVTFKS